MNCQPGDLAVSINADEGLKHNIGSLVRVIKPAEKPVAGFWVVTVLNGFSVKGVDYPPGTAATAYDPYLRPLRGSDGEDETLSWKEVPRGVTA